MEGLSTFEVLRRCANPTVFDCACGLPFSDHKFEALDLGYAILIGRLRSLIQLDYSIAGLPSWVVVEIKVTACQNKFCLFVCFNPTRRVVPRQG